MNIMSSIIFNSEGLLPVIVQDFKSREILMFAYMNAESLQKTLETKKAHYYSRSRNKLWLKGETSGHYQNVKKISVDCDKDALLLEVEQIGGACHTGHKSCFYQSLDNQEKLVENQELIFNKNKVYGVQILQAVYDVIVDRKVNPKKDSYTNYLFNEGLDKILKKVGEESAEVIIGAKNRNTDEIIYEISDLLYHLMVLMVEQEVQWDDLFGELHKRYSQS